ncbi:MAG: 3-dehydroquinate synthase [Hyphomonadaceae bacterium]
MATAASLRQTVHVGLGQRSYDILIGPGLLGDAGTLLQPFLSGQRVFVVTDENVAILHLEALEAGLKRAGITTNTRTVPAGEATKSIAQLDDILGWLIGAGANRDDVLIALGGGVIGDLTGLAASLMKRGMHFVQVPTTLLAQVDSSVGGKTAVNTRHGKNLVGAFYQPKLVLADSDVLATLPERELRAGYAEIIKYGLIDDLAFFAELEQNGQDVIALKPAAIAQAVASSCAAKARIVAQDERESGVRALLNLGHTFAHALEAANRFGPELLHGEAVGTGMALALRYSARLELISSADADRGVRAIAASGLITDISALDGGPYRANILVDHMRQDKKARGSRVPLILARELGQAFIYPEADLADVQRFLEEETGSK